ncbi:MAG: aspartyl protease family protein [Pseudomonadota bacterium]
MILLGRKDYSSTVRLKTSMNPKHHPFWRACATVVIAFAVLLPVGSQAACKVEALEIPVTMVEGRAIATLGINGIEVPFAVDSGAFFSFITHAAAKQLNLPISALPYGLRVDGVTGEVDAGKTTVKRLQLQGGDVPNVEFIVGGNEIGGGAMGLLGRNLLSIADTEYDLAHGTIRLIFPEEGCSDTNMAYWAGTTPVVELKLRDDQSTVVPAIRAIGQLNGKEIKVMFDTGAYSSVSLEAAQRAGVDKASMKAAGQMHGAGRGAVDAWTAKFQKFELGGEVISNTQLHVGDFARQNFDMFLGVDFFLSHRIYVSKSRQRMFFTYNGGPVFALDRAVLQAAGVSDVATPGASNAVQPLDAAGYARRGAASAARGDFINALADLDRACEMAPQVAAYFVRRGVVREALKQSQQAVQDYDTALRLDPLQSEARLRRAWQRMYLKDRNGVIDDLQELDKTLAAQADQRLSMATLYRALDLREQSLPQLNFWIESHPTDRTLGDALYFRCWSRALLNVQLDQALDDCNEALRRQVKNANFLSGRGWVRLRRNELRKALADFDHAIKIRPNSAWALYGRGIARRKNGEVEPGNVDIAAARKLRPSIDANASRYGMNADLGSVVPKDDVPDENEIVLPISSDKSDDGRAAK